MSTRHRALRKVAASTALVMTATMAGAAASPASAAPLDPSGGLGFDFGCATSPVADGYLQVANTMVYDAERGYGLSVATDCRDRGGDDLLADFTNASAYSFLADVPDGDYHVTVYSGDAIASNRTTVVVEGVNLGEIFSQTGQYGSVAAVVTVSDGQLDVAVGNNGRINAIEMVPVSPPSGLHVVDTTLVPEASVELAWDPVPDAAGYVVYRGESVDDLSSIDETTEPSYLDDAVDLGFSYAYAVATLTDTGVESTPSEPVTVALRDESQSPPDPPGRFRLAATTTASVTLTWQKVHDAVGYYLQRGTSPDGPFATIATVTGTTYTDEAVPSRNYYYRLYAVGLGGLSEPAPVVTSPVTAVALRQMEQLDRGLLAVPTDDGVLVSWRMLGSDPPDVRFRLYRDGTALTPAAEATSYLDSAGDAESSYQVAVVVDGQEGPPSDSVQPWPDAYLDIPLQRPDGGATPAGEEYEYQANDASAADLDGDGQYDLVLQWEPSNSKDNSQGGYTGETILDGLTLDGTLLWRIHMGHNIRAGAHYTQFMVYDLDGDGRAEVMAKTADGSVDGQGAVVGDPEADYRNGAGYILDGPEFLTVFDGLTGAALTTVDYHPPRGNVADWGDDYGNRVDRFLAGIAYLDGERPSVVMARGYYTRTVLAAYDWRDGQLTQRWVFDTDLAGSQYEGQGNHQLSVSDVDADGRDEIVYGALTVDDDGTVLYSTNLFHGDALHVSDLDPSRPGLEVFSVHEPSGADCGYELHDAATGEILWCVFTGMDTGRGAAGDIDPRYPGAEAWAVDGAFNSPTGGLHAADGELIATSIPGANHLVWWDDDLLREILDHDWEEPLGVGTIEKWDWENEQEIRLLTAEGTLSNNGTKGNPSLQADLLGDWREEVLWRTEDSGALRLYATPYPTVHRLPTLMHDPVYRLGVAWQNVAYNQPPHTSYFLGAGMALPPQPHLRTGAVVSASLQLLPPIWGGGGSTVPDVLATITLPAGHDATAVAMGTVRVVVDGELIEADDVRMAASNRVLATFDGGQIVERLADYTGSVEVIVTGHYTDGRSFTGTDTVRLG
jgi:fibronectin type 3 domain-containing protein